MVVMNQEGMDHLLSSKFKIGADASAAAGPVGRHTEADVDWKMKAEVLTYSRARGVFAGIYLSGTVVKQDKDETHILYGRMVPFESLLHGEVPAPQDAKPLLAVLEKYAPSAARQARRADDSTVESTIAVLYPAFIRSWRRVERIDLV